MNILYSRFDRAFEHVDVKVVAHEIDGINECRSSFGRGIFPEVWQRHKTLGDGTKANVNGQALSTDLFLGGDHAVGQGVEDVRLRAVHEREVRFIRDLQRTEHVAMAADEVRTRSAPVLDEYMAPQLPSAPRDGSHRRHNRCRARPASDPSVLSRQPIEGGLQPAGWWAKCLSTARASSSTTRRLGRAGGQGGLQP